MPVEHHLKLSAILAQAKKMHESIAVCWLDLANVYGAYTISSSSSPSSTIMSLLRVLETLYSGFSAKVFTADWATTSIPLQVGVYQGDPLSAVTFNTVMNMLKNRTEFLSTVHMYINCVCVCVRVCVVCVCVCWKLLSNSYV